MRSANLHTVRNVRGSGILGLVIVFLLVAGGSLVVAGWQAHARASVLVEWTTASELDTVGFNLYRSDRPEGPFSLVNPYLIPAATDPLTGGDYRYVDSAVAAGRHYYYELEDVESSGATQRHGPIGVRAAADGLWTLATGLLLLVAAGWGLRHMRSGPNIYPGPQPAGKSGMDD